jgi:hypothetical protein
MSWVNEANVKTATEKQAESAEAERQQKILRLKEIDTESLRPLRAILNGTDTQYDHDRLAELETEAQSIRATLS